MTDGRNSDLLYYRCGNCSLWNYDVSLGVDQTQYTERYVSPTDPTYKSNIDVRQTWKFFSKFAPQPGKIMEIGCGNGGLLFLARQDGWQVKGMELSAHAAANISAEQGIDVVVANFLEYEVAADEAYDVVSLRHVLEHLIDPILAMNKISSLLRSGGLALLEFPNTASVNYSIKRLLKNRGLKNKKYSKDWRPGHCNEFCKKSFEYLLNKTDFELVVWETYSSKPFANYFYKIVPVASKARVVVRKR